MPTFKVTARQTCAAGKIPKGTTFQVIGANAGTLSPAEIISALKQQFGIDYSQHNCNTANFEWVKI